MEALKESNLCEYHLHDGQGRIIITIEGAGVEEEIGKLRRIQQMPGVISAEMMFAYSEEELEMLKNRVEANQHMPAWLNDETVRAEDIRYHGDLKKRY